MKAFLTVALTLLAGAAAGAVIIHRGELLNFAGDEPHPAAVERAIVTARERFIASRAAGVEVPDLTDPQRIQTGAAHYVMCAGCHLGPGVEDTELRRGLYPQPPDLSRPPAHGPADATQAARRQFWIVKHGIKLTGMPAWGLTHDDEELWGLVAFLRKLPGMSPEEYARLRQGPAGHEHAPGAKPHRH